MEKEQHTMFLMEKYDFHFLSSAKHTILSIEYIQPSNIIIANNNQKIFLMKNDQGSTADK